MGAILELSTERSSGMGVGPIPISRIWQYLDRFQLPDWWEPVILQADAKMVAGFNKERKGNAASKSTQQATEPEHNARGGDQRHAMGTG